MFKKSNKIILIDDNEKDLEQLSKVFFENGIGCRTFQYDAFYKEPLQGVRFLFLDINLNASQSEQQRNSTLKDTIVNYIHEENGPFVLVLWTNNTEWINSFKNYINREHDSNNDFFKRSPYYLTSINKNDFYDKQKDLECKVKDIFDNPIISALFAFEDSLSTSVSKTISKIIDIIPSGNIWGDNNMFQDNLKKVFSTIAVQTLGYHYAKENPDIAIKKAMLPIFLHTFLHEPQKLWNDVLDNLKLSKTGSDILFPPDFNEAKLNSIFHIDDQCTDNRERGAVCKLDLTAEDFFNKFGYKYEEWFSISFPEVKSSERNQSILICVEFSPACDYSQQKKRTNKYLLGEILPASVDFTITQSTRKGDFLLLLPAKFEINGVTKIIGFNLNFTFTLDSSVIQEAIGTPLFRLKKEMMDMIGNKYANHVSRIGITWFK